MWAWMSPWERVRLEPEPVIRSCKPSLLIERPSSDENSLVVVWPLLSVVVIMVWPSLELSSNFW